MSGNGLAEDRRHILSHTADLWEPLRGNRVFLTGGTGFVGRWLLHSLLWADEEFRLNIQATVLTRDPARFRESVPELGADRRVEFVPGDGTSFSFAGEFPFVIHAMTERQFAATPGQPESMFGADVMATRRVLEFARTHGTRRMLFTSSGAAYGKQPSAMTHLPETYEGAPSTTDPSSAYGQAKRVSEWLCSAHATQFGFEAPIARLFAFVGPYLPLDLNFAVGNFLRDVLAGGPIKIGGDGTPYRSYLYAADLAVWLWTILLRGESRRIYNVGSPEAISIHELANTVARVTLAGTPVEVGQKPLPGAAPSRYVPDTSRAESELGLRVWTPLDEGIRRTYRWHSLGAAR